MEKSTEGDPPKSRTRIKRLAPDRELRLRKFGESLAKRIVATGLNDLQFAERCAPHMKSKKFGRDLISNYISGKHAPARLQEAAMAKALGITVEELMMPIKTGVMPEGFSGSSIEADDELRFESTGHDQARLLINMMVPMTVAIEVIGLIGRKGKK
jgi:hypothetical protein